MIGAWVGSARLGYLLAMEKPRRVFSVTVPSRVRGPENPRGAEAWVLLESLIRDAYAFAGIDADQPMRRDVVHFVSGRRPHGD